MRLSIRDASGAGYATNPPAQPAPQTRIAEADQAARLAVSSSAASPHPVPSNTLHEQPANLQLPSLP